MIRGHTQNEGDSAHSIIERAIKRSRKSGPIYVPDQYAQIIRTAKKNGNPFLLEELNFDDFYDLKKLSEDVGLNTGKDSNGTIIKIHDIKMIKFQKDSLTYSYKTNYEGDWVAADIKKKNTRSSQSVNLNEIKTINLKAAYTSKLPISQNKKKDLQELLQKNIIPKVYANFYESIINT